MNDNLSIIDNNGQLNFTGMQIKISDIIGDKLVDQFMQTISSEQMEEICKILFKQVFKEVEQDEFIDGKYERIKSIAFKTEQMEENPSWGSRGTKPTPVYLRAKETIKTRYTKLIEESVKKYIESDDYKKKAENVAKEIVDYALEGYKNDVINAVREKLVTGIVEPKQYYEDIHSIIRDEIRQALNGSSGLSY